MQCDTMSRVNIGKYLLKYGLGLGGSSLFSTIIYTYFPLKNIIGLEYLVYN